MIQYRGLLLALFATLSGSLAIITYKTLMLEGINPFTIGIIESITIMCIAALCIEWKQIPILTRFEKKIIFLTGCSQGLGTYASYLAISSLDPITFSFLGRNQTTISIFLGFIFLKERHSQKVWACILLLLLGSMMLSYSSLHLTRHYAGLIFVLISCCSFATRSYLTRCYRSNQTMFEFFFSYIVTLLLIYITVRVQHYSFLNLFSIDIKSTLLIALISICSVLASSYFYIKALNYEKLSLVSSIRLLSPYIVTLYSIVFFDYQFHPLKLGGLILMTIGIFLFISQFNIKFNLKKAVES